MLQRKNEIFRGSYITKYCVTKFRNYGIMWSQKAVQDQEEAPFKKMRLRLIHIIKISL